MLFVSSLSSCVADSPAAVFGQCCCYCKSGSPVTVYTALHPLGPWAKQNQIGFSSLCKHDYPISRTSAMFFSPGFSSHLQCNLSSAFAASVGAQQSDIFPWTDSDGVLQFMFVNQKDCSFTLAHFCFLQVLRRPLAIFARWRQISRLHILFSFTICNRRKCLCNGDG
jgi:hypothetical protein